jgi:hypothetical protein
MVVPQCLVFITIEAYYVHIASRHGQQYFGNPPIFPYNHQSPGTEPTWPTNKAGDAHTIHPQRTSYGPSHELRSARHTKCTSSSNYVPRTFHVLHPHLIAINPIETPYATQTMDFPSTAASVTASYRAIIAQPNEFHLWVVAGCVVNWSLLSIMACGMLGETKADIALFCLFFVPVRTHPLLRA